MAESGTSKLSKMHFHIENIGGISESEVTLQPGVTLLSGRNATNRTSFLQAVMAVMGSENVSLKSDSDQGRVSLELNGESYTRELNRTSVGIETGGDPYLSDPEVADLFAFLLQTNEARQAVQRDENLREILMRPVDTDTIRAEIDRLEKEKQEIDAELKELERTAQRLPELKEQRATINEKISDAEEELDSAQTALEEADKSIEQSKNIQTGFETKLEELNNKRNELESVRYNLETEQESLDSLRTDQNELQSEVEDADQFDDELSSIDNDLKNLREKAEALDSVVQQLRRVIQFNEQMLEGTNTEIVSALRDDNNDSSITQSLVQDSTVCWTCGSKVDSSKIESTIDRLQALNDEKMSDRQSLKNKIGSLQSRRKEIKQKQRKQKERRSRLKNIETEIERRKSDMEELEESKNEIIERVEELEEQVEALENNKYSEVLEHQKEVKEIEFQLDQLKDERRELNQKIERTEEKLANKENVENERKAIEQKLTEQRTKVDRIESEAVEQFNEQMAEVLSLLEYENLERVWIERSEERVREGRKKVTKSVFNLHIVRKSSSGSVYEDTVSNLSESERKVTGLIFALAGYLTHEIYDSVPFLLLDSIEAIDSDRIAALVDYISKFAENLVVALLPEDADAVDNKHRRITDI
jgi:chromosome segregation ATPase